MFDSEKQKLLIELLISNPDLFARCNGIIQPTYFEPELKKSVAYIQSHFDQFKELPSTEIIAAETGIKLTKKDAITKGEQQYTAKEVEKFCQVSAAIDAVYSGPDLIEKGDIELLWQNIKTAAAISLNTDLGISYFDNVAGRLRDLLNNSPVLSTGWREVDDALGGGISREELLLFAAASGVGKSITMANLGINLIKQGYNGIYISLELADRIVAKRFDSMVTGYSQADILKHIEEVSAKVQQFQNKQAGELYIKRMPESITTANHIRAYLKEFEQTHGYTPDFIVVDYLDLMATNRNISAENIWLADKYKAEELRSIGADFNCAIITASQLGRSSWEAEKISQAHIQGGISKIQTCDIMISIVQTDQMRAGGEYLFEYTKTRNSSAVGSATVMAWNPIALRITDFDDPSKSLSLAPKKETINNSSFGNNAIVFGADKFKSGNSEKINLLNLVHR